MNDYQAVAEMTAVYPRVYTEGQVREIVREIMDEMVLNADASGWLSSFQVESVLDEYETPFNRLVYPILGLVGEAGEIANKLKKVARDKDGQFSPELVDDYVSELGDVQWYVAAASSELDVDLNEVGERNLAKLKSRAERGTVQGSGDNR